MPETKLSLCMIVRNEAHRLSRCLDSAAVLDPELVVVDTGSTDGTPDIAARHGAKVETFDFSTVDFAAARNASLNLARGRWILVLDADEILDAESVPLISYLTGGGGDAGYYVERWNRQAKPEPPKTDYVVRLFPNRPNYRFRGRVHETIDRSIVEGGGKLLRSGVRIEHDFASNPEVRRLKNLWYIDLLKREIAADPGDSSRLHFLAAEYHQLKMFDRAAEVAEQLAQVRPLDPQAHLNVGIYHLLYKIDRSQARADFMEALRLRPGYIEAQSFLNLMDQQESCAPQSR